MKLISKAHDSSCLWKVNPQTGKTKHCRWGHLPFLYERSLRTGHSKRIQAHRQTDSQPASPQPGSQLDRQRDGQTSEDLTRLCKIIPALTGMQTWRILKILQLPLWGKHCRKRSLRRCERTLEIFGIYWKLAVDVRWFVMVCLCLSDCCELLSRQKRMTPGREATKQVLGQRSGYWGLGLQQLDVAVHIALSLPTENWKREG